jgi:hypothetical protein
VRTASLHHSRASRRRPEQIRARPRRVVSCQLVHARASIRSIASTSSAPDRPDAQSPLRLINPLMRCETEFTHPDTHAGLAQPGYIRHESARVQSLRTARPASNAVRAGRRGRKQMGPPAGCHPPFTGAGTPTPTSRPADGSLSITHALAKNWPSARRHGIAAGLCADLLRVLQMPPTMFRGAYHVVGLVVQ